MFRECYGYSIYLFLDKYHVHIILLYLLDLTCIESKGIAHAISYMHHDCIPILVDRNISGNNILLNSEVEAFVSDFGKARLLDPDSSNQTLIAVTCDYIAPK